MLLIKDEVLMEKVKSALMDYGNFNFEENVEGILQMTNKLEKTDEDVRILKPLIINFTNYQKTKEENELYMAKDSLIVLYNYLLRKKELTTV